MESEQLDKLLKRMDVIILLLLESTPGASETTTAKIERLLGFGLSTSEVARIIGKRLNYVTAVMSGKKKSMQERSSKK